MLACPIKSSEKPNIGSQSILIPVAAPDFIFRYVPKYGDWKSGGYIELNVRDKVAKYGERYDINLILNLKIFRT